MKLFEITAILMVLTALFSYINYRVLRMPTTIGVMFIAQAVSLGMVALGWLVDRIYPDIKGNGVRIR
jgi:CPA1 family monovalent cation:H+ antiporter